MLQNFNILAGSVSVCQPGEESYLEGAILWAGLWQCEWLFMLFSLKNLENLRNHWRVSVSVRKKDFALKVLFF